jgi:GDP-4-dehydro-6-deoxy-D-mannose reductase
VTDLVVGATGFVGKPLVDHLRGKGRTVVCCETAPAPGVDEVLPLHDRQETTAVLLRLAPDRIFLVADAEGAADPWGQGDALYRHHAEGTLHVLLACRQHLPDRRVLYLSSAEVYGLVPREAMPLQEDRPLYPSDPYGSSKALAEELCCAFGREGRVQVVVQRFTAIARGESDPVIRSDAVEMSRDLIHVRDAVRALVGLLQEGESGQIYNVCSGTGRSLGALTRALLQAAGVTARLEPEDNPDPMASSLWSGDVRRLRDTLGWVPAPMGEDGIRDLLAGD